MNVLPCSEAPEKNTSCHVICDCFTGKTEEVAKPGNCGRKIEAALLVRSSRKANTKPVVQQLEPSDLTRSKDGTKEFCDTLARP